MLLQHSATYSPEDNKLRLYPAHRLDKDEYARIKSAGFIWAPKQGLFVAPAWTPEREDLLLEWCDEIGDEDTSLVERAEVRAERFDTYSDKRESEAHQTREQVTRIADGIPFGQPILIGHHSERRARRDAERIENGMRKAVQLWETSRYWEQRAKGALAHAKYKELPAVRARRIKAIEADKRRLERQLEKREACRKVWESCDNIEMARFICDRTEAGWLSVVKHPTLDQYLRPSDVLPFDDRSEYAKAHYPSWTLEEVKERAAVAYGPSARLQRWLAHYDNRLTYEKAMLEEQGASALIAPKARPKQLPLVNYRQESFQVPRLYARGETETIRQIEMTQAEYKGIHDNYKGTRIVDGSHRVRVASIRKEGGGYFNRDLVAVFLTDSKAHPKPATIGLEPKPLPSMDEVTEDIERIRERQSERAEKQAAAAPFEELKASLKVGVQTVSAPQLFPTPPEIAEQMIALAELEAGQRVLEPSAGTGNLLRAIIGSGKVCDKVAVEINPQLATRCMSLTPDTVICGDFLQQNGNLGKFDRVIMNPPFENGTDVKHILHARSFLAPGGKLVALCANGPRQRESLKPIASYWEELPQGSFRGQGTGVNVALLIIDN